MNRGWKWAVAFGLLMSVGVASAAGVSTVRVVKVDKVTLRIRHRVFADFLEQDEVRMKADFPIGDTEYSGRIVEFVPDFAYDLKNHKVISRSNEPKNPAFRIIVRQKGVAQDTTWAFLNNMPHFTRKSMLAFQVLRIDFPDRPAVVSPDTTKAAQP